MPEVVARWIESKDMAEGLGVNVEAMRIIGMIICSFTAAVIGIGMRIIQSEHMICKGMANCIDFRGQRVYRKNH